MTIDLRLGDCLEVLKTIPDNSIDSVVTDPPYGLGFMGKKWDYDVPSVEVWTECLRVLKPGGHLLSFAGSRTYHRMAVRIEDAGFEIRDQIMYIYGSGFPKSHNIGKAIQKQSGDVKVIGTKQGAGTTGKSYISNNEEYVDGEKGIFKKEYDEIEINNDWEGWGTALKPAHEPIVMARKPLSEKSIAENVIRWGTGGINIDGSRIGTDDNLNGGGYNTNGTSKKNISDATSYATKVIESEFIQPEGRFPANIIFDEEAGQLLDQQSGVSKSSKHKWEGDNNAPIYGKYEKGIREATYDDKGGASRFFYCPKAAKKDRNEGLDNFEDRPSQLNSGGIGRKISVEKRLEENGENAPTMKNNHPTVKPTDLMRYLINLVTPPNGTILDPFMGSGSTGKAAIRCGVNFIGIEREQEYMDIAKARIEHEQNKPTQGELF
jgi:site-specific DNA-methyltransferase (adenine-specific)